MYLQYVGMYVSASCATTKTERPKKKKKGDILPTEQLIANVKHDGKSQEN